jgi:hypothetical protein
MAELALQPHELAYRLIRDHGTPDFAAQPATFAGLVSPSNNQSSQALLMRQSSSEDRTYTLVVTQDRATVLYDLKEMFELNPQGGKYAALAGDVRKVAGQSIFPRLYEVPGVTSRTSHRAKFVTKAVAARPWEDIEAALGAGPEVALVDPPVIPEGEDQVPPIHAQMALPLPPWLAALYLRSPSLRQAFLMTHTLRRLVPAESRALWAPLFEFMRGAITHDPTVAGQSAQADVFGDRGGKQRSAAWSGHDDH